MDVDAALEVTAAAVNLMASTSDQEPGGDKNHDADEDLDTGNGNSAKEVALLRF